MEELDAVVVESMEDMVEELDKVSVDLKEDLEKRLVEDMVDLVEDMGDLVEGLDTVLVKASFSTIKTGVDATKLVVDIKRANTSMLLVTIWSSCISSEVYSSYLSSKELIKH